MTTYQVWTPEELETLIRVYPKTRDIREFATTLPNHPLHSIRHKARSLGVYREKRSRRSDAIWTDEHIEHLKEAYARIPLARDLLTEFPDFTINQIRSKARYLGLHRTASLGKQSPMSLSPTQAAYIAGLVDGEGSITLKATHNKKRVSQLQLNPAVYVYNSNTDVLEWLKATVPDLSSVRMRGGKWARDGAKPVHEWKVGGYKSVAQLLNAILPYLIIKRRQAELMLGFCENRVQFAAYTDHELELWEALKAANKRGV